MRKKVPSNTVPANNTTATAVSLVSLFGLTDSTQSCDHSLTQVFQGAHSIFDIFSIFEKLDQLRQAGVFLDTGLVAVSVGGLIWAIAQIILHHFHRAKHHLDHFKATTHPNSHHSRVKSPPRGHVVRPSAARAKHGRRHQFGPAHGNPRARHKRHTQ